MPRLWSGKTIAIKHFDMHLPDSLGICVDGHYDSFSLRLAMKQSSTEARRRNDRPCSRIYTDLRSILWDLQLATLRNRMTDHARFHLLKLDPDKFTPIHLQFQKDLAESKSRFFKNFYFRLAGTMIFASIIAAIYFAFSTTSNRTNNNCQFH